ncbi:MAG: YlqD family protein [Armatimonadetes bacterium]|nr:YlqD family protein [Armatimonadota bacterium]
MPDSIVIKRDVILRAVVTEKLKEDLDAEFGAAIDELDRQITRLDIGARQYLTELQRSDIQQAMAVRQQIEAEKRRLQQGKEQLIQRRRQVEELELGSEIIRGTVEGQVELHVGDNFQTVTRGVEIVLKDDEVIDIRETEGGLLEPAEEVRPELASEIETP